MKLFALVFTTWLALASPAHADEAFSVRDWADSLESAIEEKNAADIAALLDIASIEQSVLGRKAGGDRALMAAARKLFEQGKFKESIAYYEQVKKGSDFWLESVEEKGWAYIRLEQFDRALSQTKTLLSPAFNEVVGSEPFFLQSLAQLRACDYKGILQTHKLFKDSNRRRVVEIQNIVNQGTVPAFNTVIDNADSFPMILSQVREQAKVLPRLFWRDIDLQRSLLRLKMAEFGIPVLQKALSEGRASPLLQRGLARLDSNRLAAGPALGKRIRVLAQIETNENHKMLQKLNLIEVETIQRVHIDQGVNPDKYARNKFEKTSSDQLVFADDGRPWLDELDKYQFEVSSCPKNIKRRM